jgi:small subunit ribosomal protein S17
MASKRRKIGTITSDKMDKTVVVTVESFREHPLYHKKYKHSNKIKADNPENKFKMGNVVEIEETKPLSKQKSWKVVRLIEK